MDISAQNTNLLQAFNEFNVLPESLVNSYNQLNESFACYSLSQADPGVSVDNSKVTQHLRALLDAIPGAVIVINTKGQVVDVNVAATELLGQPLMDALWRDVVYRVFLAELDQGELRTSDGRQFSISTRPLGYQPGQILLLSDVTQTRQLQRAAQQNLHLMTMGKMMASLAHQIRTPLASTMLYLSQVVDAELPAEKSQKFTAKALQRVKHIETMINDMLVFAHGGQFHMSDFAVSSLLSELNDQLLPHLKLRSAGLELNVPDRPLLINGNKDALLGALANICMNAMDAAQQQLHIRIDVSTSRQGDMLITIADNGCGMDEKILQHLFDPFFTTKMDGTGLGLAVVKSVIESHQGKISVVSTPGQGSRFDIQLPCLQASKTQLSQTRKEVKSND
ncbi:MAG: PAS domain-containing protein [Gammaproteobacteria bacterium]|nr:PAS domain-containing protein [Gammaproteobacteria bacterium]